MTTEPKHNQTSLPEKPGERVRDPGQGARKNCPTHIFCLESNGFLRLGADRHLVNNPTPIFFKRTPSFSAWARGRHIVAETKKKVTACLWVRDGLFVGVLANTKIPPAHVIIYRSCNCRR